MEDNGEHVARKLDMGDAPSTSGLEQRNISSGRSNYFKTLRSALQGIFLTPRKISRLLESNSSDSDEPSSVEHEAVEGPVRDIESQRGDDGDDDAPMDLNNEFRGFVDEDNYPSDIDSYHDYSGAEDNEGLRMQLSTEDPESDSHDSDGSDDSDAGIDKRPAVRRRMRRSTRSARFSFRGRRRGRQRGSLISSVSPDPNEGDDGWTEDASPPTLHPFTGSPGLKVPCPTTPLAFFQLFFPIEVLLYIMHETNDYAIYIRTEMGKQDKSFWSGCSAQDIAVYLGIMMWTGVVRMPDLKMFWAKDETSYVPRIASAMPRNRFLTINKFFHTFNRRAIPKNNNDKLILIRPLMEFFRVTCESVYVPTEHLSLDEGMLKWKGRLSIKVYNPMKPTKYGIKIYFLCESQTGYVLNFSIYRGVTVTLRDVVFDLMNKYMNQGYHVFMDNYYNSVALAEELYANGTHCSGTLRVNRGAPQYLRNVVKNKTLKRGEMAFRRKDNTFVICWQDVRMVTLITNAYNNEAARFTPTRKVKREGKFHYDQVEMQRPVVVKQYINYMGGVDLFDQMVNYYAFARRTNRWTKKAVLYLIQLAMLNAFKLYQQFSKDKKKMSHRQFHCHIADKLLYFNEKEWPFSDAVISRAADLPMDERADRPPRSASAGTSAGISTGTTAGTSGTSARISTGTTAGTSGTSAGISTGTTAGTSGTSARISTGTTAGTSGTSTATSQSSSDDGQPGVLRKRQFYVDPATRLQPGKHTKEKLDKGSKQRRCRVCYKSGRRYDTSFICGLCKVPLCRSRGCFETYHRDLKFWDSPPPSAKTGRKRKHND